MPAARFSDYSATVYPAWRQGLHADARPLLGVFATDACAMVVAEEMGAKWEDVIIEYDTKAAFTPVGGGSDGTTAGAWVMKEAAAKFKQLVLEAAAPTLKAKPEDLDTKDSTVFVKSDSSKSIPFAQIQTLGRDNTRGNIIATALRPASPGLLEPGMGKEARYHECALLRSRRGYGNRASGSAETWHCRGSRQGPATDVAGKPDPPGHDVPEESGGQYH